MIDDVQISPGPALRGNSLEAFHRFKSQIMTPIKFGSGDVLAKVKLTYYVDGRIIRCEGTALLIDHGDAAGTIGLTANFHASGLSEINDTLIIKLKEHEYCSGRSSGVLSIDMIIKTDRVSVARVDVEEQLNEFVFASN